MLRRAKLRFRPRIWGVEYHITPESQLDKKAMPHALWNWRILVIFLIFSSGVISKNPDSDPGYEVLNITSDPGSESKSHPEEKAIRWKWSILVYFLIFSCVTAAMLKYLDSDPGYEVLNITVAPWVRSQILRQWSLRSLWEMFAFKKMFVLKVPPSTSFVLNVPQSLRLKSLIHTPQSGWIWSALLSYLHCTL